MDSNILGKYPFSLFDIDGSWDIWQTFYSPYIDLIESKLKRSNHKTLSTFRNYDFAVNNANYQRIADLIIIEIEDEKSNPSSKSSGNNFENLNEKIEDQYSDEVEKENSNFRITFVFTNKKRQQLKLLQMLKLSGEVKKYTQLLHKKVLKQYSRIIPQIIFISLFGFETSVGDYLRNNLHGNLNGNLSLLIVPSIENNLWNNYFLENPMKGKNDYKKHKSGINFEDFNNLRNSGGANQFQVKQMETYYKNLMETKKISEYNFQELNFWADILSINISFKILDVKNSIERIKELVI